MKHAKVNNSNDFRMRIWQSQIAIANPPTDCPHSHSASVSQSLRQYFMQITAELCHGSDDNDDSLDNCQ